MMERTVGMSHAPLAVNENPRSRHSSIVRAAGPLYIVDPSQSTTFEITSATRPRWRSLMGEPRDLLLIALIDNLAGTGVWL